MGAHRMVLSLGSTVANIAVSTRVNIIAGWMVAPVTMKAFIQEQRTRAMEGSTILSIHEPARRPPGLTVIRRFLDHVARAGAIFKSPDIIVLVVTHILEGLPG